MKYFIIRYDTYKLFHGNFLSHPILARGGCISAREPTGWRTDIQRTRANIGCDIKIA